MPADPTGPSDPADAEKRGVDKHGLATRLTHSGRDKDSRNKGVNPPVQRASTILMDSAADLFRPGLRTYGRHGTATHDALKEALCELENASHCLLVSSGLQACVLPLLALANAGDHVLVIDNAYGPTRRFIERSAPRWGIEGEFFDPAIGAGIARLIRPNTKAILFESPGSQTFEVTDTRAIAAAAKAAGVATVLDNSWAAGICLKPLDLGVDISVHSTTKYISGGADALNGAVLTRDDRLARAMADTIADLGVNVAADDAALVLRGLRTLPTRMDRHAASALTVAHWLETHSAVRRVLHPALANDPGHALWKQDFSGASGLFGFVLQPAERSRVNAFLDALHLFGLGFSYGGFESLAILCDPQLKRTVSKPDLGGPLVRLSIGLEDPADLIADLDQAFAALK